LHGTSEWGKRLVIQRGGTLTGKTKYVCQSCQKEFFGYPRYPNPRKFCSKECASNRAKSNLPV
jgi:transposase-like protein